jgi:hypothetical protein
MLERRIVSEIRWEEGEGRYVLTLAVVEGVMEMLRKPYFPSDRRDEETYVMVFPALAGGLRGSVKRWQERMSSMRVSEGMGLARMMRRGGTSGS